MKLLFETYTRYSGVNDEQQKKNLLYFNSSFESILDIMENFSCKRRPQGHNLILTLNIFELLMKSEKKKKTQVCFKEVFFK